MIKYSVGLDVSAKKINGCIATIDSKQTVIVKSYITITNGLSGFRKLDSWIVKNRKEKNIPLVICMEATGIYHENCALFLAKNQYEVSVVLPNKAKKYLESLGHKSKNDSIDARGLAQMGAQQSLAKWQPMDEFFYILRGYTRQHQNLQEQKTVLKNQLHAAEKTMYPNKVIIRQLKKQIALLDKQQEEIEIYIEEHISGNQEIKQKVENICVIKGVGILSVATVIAETNGFKLFENSRQLVSYAGYDVVENQSGNRSGKTKISKKGNSRIRRVLFMPAFSVVTNKQTAFVNLYNRTLSRHQIKMKSYVAVQKKLLTTIYALWKNDEAYNNDFHIINIQEQEQVLTSLWFNPLFFGQIFQKGLGRFHCHPR